MLKQEEEIASRLKAWQQGDYALGCDPLLLQVSPEDQNDLGIRVDDAIEGLAVVTQTCDVVRTPSVVSSVTVCPIIRIPVARRQDVAKGVSPRYALLAGLPEGAVVDLTRAMTVDKARLVEWPRSRGCVDELDQRRFARALERAFGRYAFPDAFVSLLDPVRRSIERKHGKDASPLGQVLKLVQEMRVIVHTSWTDDNDVPVSFYVIVDEAVAEAPETVAEVHAALRGEVDRIKWFAPYRLHDQGVQVTTLSDLSAREYVDSYALSVNDLSEA